MTWESLGSGRWWVIIQGVVGDLNFFGYNWLSTLFWGVFDESASFRV